MRTLFWALRSSMLQVGWEDWRALVVLTVGMGFAAITLTNIASIALQHSLFPETKERLLIVWGPIYMGLAIANYYTLIADRKWSRFAAEFKHHPKTMRILGRVAVWIGIILLVVVAYWTGSIAFKLPRYSVAT